MAALSIEGGVGAYWSDRREGGLGEAAATHFPAERRRVQQHRDLKQHGSMWAPQIVPGTGPQEGGRALRDEQGRGEER